MTKKTLPRASVDARDAEDDAKAFRRHPRFGQGPRRGPLRLPHVGSCGVLLQDAVSVAVRPKHPRRRGSGDGRESPLPVRGGAGAIAVSIRHADARALDEVDPRHLRRVLLEDARGPAARQGAGETDRARGSFPMAVDGTGHHSSRSVKCKDRRVKNHRDPPSPDARVGDHPSRPQGGAAARVGADPQGRRRVEERPREKRLEASGWRSAKGASAHEGDRRGGRSGVERPARRDIDGKRLSLHARRQAPGGGSRKLPFCRVESGDTRETWVRRDMKTGATRRFEWDRELPPDDGHFDLKADMHGFERNCGHGGSHLRDVFGAHSPCRPFPVDHARQCSRGAFQRTLRH